MKWKFISWDVWRFYSQRRVITLTLIFMYNMTRQLFILTRFIVWQTQNTVCFVICHSLRIGGGGDLSCVYYLSIIHLLFIFIIYLFLKYLLFIFTYNRRRRGFIVVQSWCVMEILLHKRFGAADVIRKERVTGVSLVPNNLGSDRSKSSLLHTDVSIITP